jgi:hypothetical protein
MSAAPPRRSWFLASRSCRGLLNWWGSAHLYDPSTGSQTLLASIWLTSGHQACPFSRAMVNTKGKCGLEQVVCAERSERDETAWCSRVTGDVIMRASTVLSQVSIVLRRRQ